MFLEWLVSKLRTWDIKQHAIYVILDNYIEIELGKDHDLVMSLSNEELAELRSWLKRLIIKREKSKNAIKAKKWRDKKRGYSTEERTNWSVDKYHHICHKALTPENIITDGKGRKYCRYCYNKRVRQWRAKRKKSGPSKI